MQRTWQASPSVQSGVRRPNAAGSPASLFLSFAYKFRGRGVILSGRMEAGAQSDRHWAEALFETHAAGLILYGRALGLSHSESEDGVQDLFAALLQLESPPREPVRYLLRSFRNLALNRRRGLWRRLARELESREWFEAPGDPNPLEAAAIAELAQLPSEQREVIVLKIWQSFTFDEIGEITGVSPNTAAGRYRYGMDRLRRCLELSSDPELRSLVPR